VRVRRVNPPEQERAALRRHGQAAERLETPAALLKVLRGKLVPVRTAASSPVAQPPKPKPMIAQTKPANAGRPGADFDRPVAASKPVIPPAKTPPKAAATPGKPLPTPKPTPVPPPAPVKAGGYVVQVGAYSSQSRADALAKSLGGRVEPAGGVWRVRLGPYATKQAAQAGVRTAAGKGFENATIIANDAR
jgi:rare lipoprotein A